MTKYWHTRPIIVALAIERESRRFASSQLALYLPLIHLFSLLTLLPKLIILLSSPCPPIHSDSSTRYLFLVYFYFCMQLCFLLFFRFLRFSCLQKSRKIYDIIVKWKIITHSDIIVLLLLLPHRLALSFPLLFSLSLLLLHPLNRWLILTAKDILLSFFFSSKFEAKLLRFFSRVFARDRDFICSRGHHKTAIKSNFNRVQFCLPKRNFRDNLLGKEGGAENGFP